MNDCMYIYSKYIVYIYIYSYGPGNYIPPFGEDFKKQGVFWICFWILQCFTPAPAAATKNPRQRLVDSESALREALGNSKLNSLLREGEAVDPKNPLYHRSVLNFGLGSYPHEKQGKAIFINMVCKKNESWEWHKRIRMTTAATCDCWPSEIYTTVMLTCVPLRGNLRPSYFKDKTEHRGVWKKAFDSSRGIDLVVLSSGPVSSCLYR